MNAFMFRAAPTAAILALAALAPSFGAASDNSVRYTEAATRDVYYADLNLRSTAGIARLHSRIAYAAKVVCGGEDRTSLANALRREQCRMDTIQRAVASLNSTALSAYHEERTLVASR